MEVSNEEILSFIDAIKNSSPYDFSEYSEKSFRRRLEKILADNNYTMDKLIAKINKDHLYLEKIVKDITVNTTEMFRDPKVWHELRYKILPQLKNKEHINIWHAGSSTGEELYSMLILLGEMELFDKTSIYGSDLNSDVIETSKNGQYRYKFNAIYIDNYNAVMIDKPGSEEKYQLDYEKYFTIDKTRDIIKMNKFLLDKPIFAKHDLVSGTNIFDAKFDLIICRNVLIYFNNNLQNKVFDLFHRSLNDSGYLVIGLHESILGPLTAKFEKKSQVYQKK
ncbi:MAG: hypothetical protein A2W91_07475 [Bacteroidetes bacterium GWF2_38_335]|nr:MAG: hypothetical protein A2W91_07475 [Bacteroidetes bacterium GWF2_38_335]OFY78564.1 MAG: hypothetical protein A2281_17765 [Bacteroidetes bacterium RIFOXYA12_FULL_38_20]HBS85060.1 chemotaxis protein CheR [Bacteroidales bacterium]